MQTKKLVIAKYNSTWKSYDELYGEEQKRKYEAILRKLSIKDYTGKIIIDIGCGTGSFICKIACKSRSIIGIDISENMLREAERKIGNYKWKVSLILADAENIPVKKKCIDYAFAITLIQNLPNPEKFLDETHRILKKNGRTVITAIKRMYSQREIESLIEATGKFKALDKIEREDVKDIIIFCIKV